MVVEALAIRNKQTVSGFRGKLFFDCKLVVPVEGLVEVGKNLG